jgi:uroporphyrinogen-III decarboxylase
LLDGALDRKEFIAAPECDLAPETPLENVKAFVQAVKSDRC